MFGIKRSVRRGFGLAIFGVMACAGLAYATVPGWHRAMTPGAFGLHEIAPRVFTDAPQLAREIAENIAKADATTQAFFGALRSDPMIIACTTQACADRFGLGTRGLTLGAHIVLIGPGGVNELITTHERIHAELHARMGVRDIWDQRYPAWFDEGLASHLSGDTRLNMPGNPRDADWIRSATGFRDWSALHGTHRWQNTYGAAARLVAEIEATLGRDGVLDLIEEVARGGDFKTVLDAAMGQ